MFLIVISTILVTIVSLTVWFRQSFILYKRRVDKMLENVKMYGGNVPFFGHLLYIFGLKIGNAEEIYKMLVEIAGNINEDRRFWIFNVPVFIATTPKTIEKIFTNPLVSVEKSYIYQFFSDYVNYGVFIATTNKWRKMRKRLNMTFNPKFFPFFIDEMNLQAYTFVSEVRKRLLSGENGYENILPCVTRLFFDSITSTHFGLNTHRQLQTSQTTSEAAAKYMEFLIQRVAKPWLRFDFIYNMTANFQKSKSVFEHQLPYIDAIGRLSQEYQKKVDSIGNSLGWKSYAEHIKEGMEEMGVKPSPSKIGNGILDLIVAGTDTASVAVCHLLYQLGLHHEYQDIAYNEIMEVLHNDCIDSNETKTKGHNNIKELINEKNNIKTDNLLKEMNNTRNNTMGKGIISESISNKPVSELDLNDESNWMFTEMTEKKNIIWTKRKLDRLQFLEQMIKESIRLSSPPIIFRKAQVDIDMGDFVLPKGTEIFISAVINAHKNPKYWEKPEAFYPEHFDPEKVKDRPKYTYMPFSHGPRDCPGKVYAMYAMKCLVSEILRNFKVETKPPNSPVTCKLLFMVEHSDGYQVRFIPRD